MGSRDLRIVNIIDYDSIYLPGDGRNALTMTSGETRRDEQHGKSTSSQELWPKVGLLKCDNVRTKLVGGPTTTEWSKVDEYGTYLEPDEDQPQSFFFFGQGGVIERGVFVNDNLYSAVHVQYDLESDTLARGAAVSETYLPSQYHPPSLYSCRCAPTLVSFQDIIAEFPDYLSLSTPLSVSVYPSSAR